MYACTLSPIIMEVEHGSLEDDFSVQGGRIYRLHQKFGRVI